MKTVKYYPKGDRQYEEEKYYVCLGMKVQGGAFVKSLG